MARSWRQHTFCAATRTPHTHTALPRKENNIPTHNPPALHITAPSLLPHTTPAIYASLSPYTPTCSYCIHVSCHSSFLPLPHMPSLPIYSHYLLSSISLPPTPLLYFASLCMGQDYLLPAVCLCWHARPYLNYCQAFHFVCILCSCLPFCFVCSCI